MIFIVIRSVSRLREVFLRFRILFFSTPFYVKQLNVVARKARISVPLYGVRNMLLQ